MEVKDMIAEIESGRYSVTYYRPSAHVLECRFEDDPYSNVRYIINEDGGSDEDYGCFEVEMHCDLRFRFDWYFGKWDSDDPESMKFLQEPEFVETLNRHFADIAICVGPNGEHWDDVELWRRFISRCIKRDDSLMPDIEVMSANDNAQAPNPASYAACRDSDWLGVEIYERR